MHAACYVLERRLFDWLLQQNCERGVAPSSRALLEQVPNMLPGSLDEAIRSAILEASMCRRLPGDSGLHVGKGDGGPGGVVWLIRSRSVAQMLGMVPRESTFREVDSCKDNKG